MQRLFVGVALDEPTRNAIEHALEGVRAEAVRLPTFRELPAESWHFTLQFLGAVEDALVSAVGAACARAAARQTEFELELSGAGAFGSPRRARVLFIGVSRGGDSMRALRDSLLVETEPLGFAREERQYSPHLTFARLRQPANVERLLASLRLTAPSMPVRELTLFRSHLSQQGARYEALARYPLAARA